MVTNVRASQVVGEVLSVSVPNARASQVVVEPLVVNTPQVRVSQVVLEALVVDSAAARCSQLVIEVLCLNLDTNMLPVYPKLIGLGYNVKWSPLFFNMPTQTTGTGADIDLGLSGTPLHDFELTYEFLRDQPVAMQQGASELKLMMGFFLRLAGTVGRFLFDNPDDNRVCAEAIGTTDGTSSVYGPITRTYGVGLNVGTEPVGVVNLSVPAVVYLNGVRQDSSTYTLLTDSPCNQQVKFNATPSAGQAITMDLGYFYYAKFPDNTYTFEKFMDRLWLLNTVHIHSCRPGA